MYLFVIQNEWELANTILKNFGVTDWEPVKQN